MKKITLCLASLFVLSTSLFSQAFLQVEAPQNNGSTTQQRAPNGTAAQAYMRACALVLASEMNNLPSGSTISDFGFTLQTGTSGTPVSGNFTLYLQNTSDNTYLKGTNFANAITGMTSVFANVMTIPLSAGATSILITLSTPFVYTGGGLYVAYDWASTGPFTSGTIATYYAESVVLTPGCASAASSVSSPTLLTTTNFRPSFIFRAPNLNSNDIQVLGVEANGKVPLVLNQNQVVSALIKNASNQVNSNIQVNCSVSGANVALSNINISSLAAGASTLVSFTPYLPANTGLNTISVSVTADQNNSNNSKTFAQLVNCNLLARNPGAGSYTNGAVGYGNGAGIIGTGLFNPISATLTGINFAISTNTASIGGQIYGVLMNATGGILATTNTLTIGASHLNSFQEFSFANPQGLTAATNYVIGMAQLSVPSLTYYPAGTQTSNYLPNGIYQTTGITGGALAPLTQNFGYFGIEAIYQHSANVSITASPTLVCIGGSANLQANGAVSNYTWSTGSNAQTIVITPSASAAFSVVTTNSIGCRSSAVATVNVSNLPNVTAGSSSPSVCVGSSITLIANGAVSYSWAHGPTGSSVVEYPTANANYVVTGANAVGCTNTAVVNITVTEPQFTVSSNTIACGPNPVALIASGPAGYTYLWSNNMPFPSITVTVSSNTVFSVTATDPNFCTKTETVLVTSVPSPTVLATASQTRICRNESLTLNASGANTYSWSTSATGSSIVITANSNGNFTYSVTGTDANNCSSTGVITINVSACVGLEEIAFYSTEPSVYPNPSRGDLTVTSPTFIQNSEIQLVNQLGQVLLRQEILKKDTSLDLNALSPGVYVLLIKAGEELVYRKKIVKE